MNNEKKVLQLVKEFIAKNPHKKSTDFFIQLPAEYKKIYSEKEILLIWQEAKKKKTIHGY